MTQAWKIRGSEGVPPTEKRKKRLKLGGPIKHPTERIVRGRRIESSAG